MGNQIVMSGDFGILVAVIRLARLVLTGMALVLVLSGCDGLPDNDDRKRSLVISDGADTRFGRQFVGELDANLDLAFADLKVHGKNWEQELLISQLAPYITESTDEVIMISPYFVPRQTATDELCELVQDGVRVES